jgi:predicted metal-dependent hydrolase
VRDWLLRRHPHAHQLRTDKALYGYVDDLKNDHLRKAGTIHKVVYDNKVHIVRNALGTHTRRSVVQGSRLNTRHEIRIAALFRQAPEAFLRMITVHELAHLRELDHDKAFLQAVHLHGAELPPVRIRGACLSQPCGGGR